MAITSPVNSWDARCLAVAESTLGTTPTPGNVAALAAQALEFSAISMGPAAVGATRAKKDRALGRGMTTGFVEGRQGPIPWSLEVPVKSRSAIDADPREVVLYAAAGLKKTTNGSTSCVLSPSATPVESSDFTGMSLTRILGASPATYELEVMRGCVAQSLRWEGGDKEVLLKAAGNGLDKATMGAMASAVFADGVGTTLSHTAEESYRLHAGYYLCGSEIILLGTVTPGSTSTTVTRGALSSTAALHGGTALQPYLPTGIAYSGSPIAETTATCTIGGVSSRVMSWFFEYSTGIEHLGGETGSRYAQGVKYGRFDGKLGVKMVLSAAQVSLLGKATSRLGVEVDVSQGTGTGAVWSLAVPYAEVEAFAVPDAANDIAIVDVSFRLRDDTAGNNMFSITLT